MIGSKLDLMHSSTTISLVLFVTCGSAFAGQPVLLNSDHSVGIAPPYFEVPGELEFSGELIVRLKQDLNKSQRATALGLISKQTVRQYLATDEFILSVGLTPEQIGIPENRRVAELLSTGLFQYAHPNWIVYPTVIPNDPRLNEQWHHTTLKPQLRI